MAVQPDASVPQLPELVTNPLASVLAAPCEIRVVGHTLQIPAMSAAEWLELLMGELDLELIFPGLLSDDDRELVEELLLDEEMTLDELQRRSLEIIAEVSGRPWWVALRMIDLAQSRWSVFGGALVMAGIRSDMIPLGAWLDAVWVITFDSLPKDKWTMLASLIEALPPSEMPEDRMDAFTVTTDAFTEFMRE